jgi:hypothetical protein
MKTHFKRSWHSLGLTVMMAVSSLYTSASVPATIGMATASAANDPQITTTSAPAAPDKVGWQDNCSNAIKTTTVKDLDTEKCNCNCDMSVMSGDRPEARAVIDDHPRPAAPIYSSNNYLNSHIALKKWTAALRLAQESEVDHHDSRIYRLQPRWIYCRSPGWRRLVETVREVRLRL